MSVVRSPGWSNPVNDKKKPEISQALDPDQDGYDD
jgi:hypothetical protein